MKLLSFMEKQSSESYMTIFVMCLVAGMAECLMLALVNTGADSIYNDKEIIQELVLCSIALLIFIYSLRYASSRTVVIIENSLSSTRARLCEKLRSIDMEWLEKNDTHKLYTRLTKDTAVISQATPMLVFSSMSFVVLIFATLYLVFISVVSFLIALVVTTGFFLMYGPQSEKVRKDLERGKEQDVKYFQVLESFLEGFKELKINRVKSDDFNDHFVAMSNSTLDLKLKIGDGEAKSWALGRMFTYVLLIILVFVVPLFIQSNSSDVHNVTTTMLFLTMPIGVMLNLMPTLRRVEVVIMDLQNLEEEIDAATKKYELILPEKLEKFTSLRFVDLEYTYPVNADGSSFKVGPVNQEISRGELVFIVGGNGSGKSTFLKLLIGLYMPTAGKLSLNEHPLVNTDYTTYRQLFATVFTDFHLFDRLYGLNAEQQSKVNYWLKRMQLDKKTAYRHGGFTNRNLSTGQRKRLAFIAAILEDKPILILDEFAADQDPEFRKYFYETLIPELKTAGKTVIAVSHDDQYFHLPDRILKLDLGKLVAFQR